jgi:predicted extracellular nuclease
VLAIRSIQGLSHISPYVNQAVAGVPGIVTQRVSNGFYFQDPNPDADDRTSEGIFVFTNSAPTVNVGDYIVVSGTVAEFAPGGGSNLAITEITGPSLTIVVFSTGNPLPPPIVIGTGGRIPPNQVIYNGSAIDLNTQAHILDSTNGIDFYESLEGMRVQLNNVIVVGPTNTFGETAVIADTGANASLLTPRGGIVVRSNDFNPERIIIKDVPITPARYDVGTRITSVVGVITYNAGNYMLLRDQTLALNVDTTALPAPETTSLLGTSTQLTIASYMALNLDPGDGAARFDAIAGQIVNNLKSPDIIAAQEIQDNNGETNDPTVDASTTLTMLINAIVSAGGPAYQYRSIDPVDDQDGGLPGANGRIVLLFNPARVSFVDRPGGTATTGAVVNNSGGIPQLSVSPGRIDPTNAAWNNSRKPLAGEFVFGGKRFFVIAGHFNSKGGDQPLFGRNQPPALPSEAQRIQQAGLVQNFVASILAVDANARVVVLGDLNDYQFSAPLTTLKGSNLHNLTEMLPENQRYTYIFEGNSLALDHVLVSNSVFTGVEYDVVHVNSEYVVQATDHDPPVARLLFGTPCVLDLDGNGSVDALTDGLMLVRAMSGLTGTAVTNGAIGGNASRTTWAAIQPYFNPAVLDVDQDSGTDPRTDGLLLMRAMFGLTGTAVTNNALGMGANRDNWSKLRYYLNTSCGASFAP